MNRKKPPPGLARLSVFHARPGLQVVHAQLAKRLLTGLRRRLRSFEPNDEVWASATPEQRMWHQVSQKAPGV